MHSTYQLLNGKSSLATDLSARAWLTIASDLDLSDPSLPQDGVGQAESAHRRIQWVCAGGGATLAIQGFDKALGRCWELAIVHLPGDRIAISAHETCPPACAPDSPEDSPSKLEEKIWSDLTSGLELQNFHPSRQPAFLSLVASAISPAGVVSTLDESPRMIQLEHDIQYWRDLARSQARLLKARARPAEATPSGNGHEASTPSQEKSEEVRQWKLSEIDEWAALNSDRIAILPRAISEAKRSTYGNHELVFQCLEMLAHEYRLVKTGEAPRNAYRDRATELLVEFGGSVDPSVAGEKGDQYFVRWGGQRRFLDQHLSKGTSRDKRFALRIYFTWDPDEAKVIVGWLPTHLANSKT